MAILIFNYCYTIITIIIIIIIIIIITYTQLSNQFHGVQLFLRSK
jgi:hypothetical protein